METIKLKKSKKNAEVQDNSKSSKLIEREDLAKTPFTVVTTNGESFGTMGKYRITEFYATKEEVKKDLEQMTWNRIVQVAMLVAETMKEQTIKN